MFSVWVATVLGLMTRRSAISPERRPSPSSASTSCSRRGRRGVGGAGTGPGPAGHDPQARKDLVGRRRLGDVVVGADEQAGDAVIGLRARAREEDDRELGPEVGLQRPADLVAGDAAERYLEDRGDGPALARADDRLGAVGDLDDAEVTGAQDIGEAFPRLDVRISDEHRVGDLNPSSVRDRAWTGPHARTDRKSVV